MKNLVFSLVSLKGISDVMRLLRRLKEHWCLVDSNSRVGVLGSGVGQGDSDLSRLILEKTLGFGSGLLDMLRERLDLRPLPCSPLTFGVLDSNCCDTSWIFEFLPEHPSKLRHAFTSFSLSCYAFSLRGRGGDKVCWFAHGEYFEKRSCALDPTDDTNLKLLPKCHVVTGVGQTGIVDIGGSCSNGSQQVDSTGIVMYGVSRDVADVNANVYSTHAVSKRKRVDGHINDVGLYSLGSSLSNVVGDSGNRNGNLSGQTEHSGTSFTAEHNAKNVTYTRSTQGNSTETSGTHTGVILLVPGNFLILQIGSLSHRQSKTNGIVKPNTSGIYDAIMRGDSDGSDCGGRLILPQSFTVGPRYMYAHYLDALAICHVHGNPLLFITFTCNVKWPEITEYMEDFPGLTTTDRADIVDRVFEMKIHQFVKYLRDAQPFRKIIAVMYTAEFQKRGLPHCHTLVCIDERSWVQRDEDIDAYISVEVPSKDVDPECHRVVSELILQPDLTLIYRELFLSS
ncbi:DNA helicase [Tanacetum coccineum]